MTNMKKDFQKIVRMFRDKMPDVHYIDHWTKEERTCRPEYPKAMMTAQQERLHTATVNFGRGSLALTAAECFRIYEPFKTWCESYGITATTVELRTDNYYQVRINY